MNVLVVSSWCPFPTDNGSRVRAHSLLRQLAGRGHILTLFALSQPETDTKAALRELGALCAGGVRLFPPSAKRRHGRPGHLPRSVLRSWNGDMEQAVHDAVQSGAFDRALFLEPGVMMYAPVRPAVPCLLDCMEVSRFVRQRPTLRVLLMLWKLRRYLRGLAPRFALWTAASETEHDAVAAFVGRETPPLSVVPNGVDLEWNAFTDSAPVDINRMVLNGAPDFPPNAQGAAWLASDVLPLMHKIRPAAHLWVTGRADTLPPSHVLRHAANVTLTGYLDDVRPAVWGAGVCAVPLFEGGGTRLKVLEAMALGTPVVSTSIGAEGIGIVHGEHLLLADTPAEFAQAVLSVMNDNALREQLRRAARRFVEASFGWDAIGAQLDGLLSAPCP